MSDKKDWSGIYQIIAIVAIAAFVVCFYFTGEETKQEDIKTPGAYEITSDKTKTATGSDYTNNHKIAAVTNDFQKYKYRYDYIINVEGNVEQATFKVPLPDDEIDRQKISNKKLSPEPDKIYITEPNIIAEYNFRNLKTGQYKISLEGIAHIKTYEITRAKKINKNSDPEKDIKRYLIAERYIESSHPMITDIASKITGNTREEIVRNIYEYVKDNMEYTTAVGDLSATQALKARRGKCSEYAAIMVSLCRAKKIPARVVTGNIARNIEPKHTWVEVYFDEYGWVTYDPTVMSSYRNVIKDGKIVSRQRLADKVHNYIASIRNDFSPWFLTYSVAENQLAGKITLNEQIRIQKIK